MANQQRDLLHTETVALGDRVDELQDEIESVHEERDELLEQYENATTADERDSIESEYNSIEEERVVLETEQNRFKDIMERSTEDDPTFIIEELTYGEMQKIQDEVTTASFDVDVDAQDLDGAPKSGMMRSLFLQDSVVKTPSGLPNNPGDYPQVVMEWLYEKVDVLNTRGQTEVENLSISEATSADS